MDYEQSTMDYELLTMHYALNLYLCWHPGSAQAPPPCPSSANACPPNTARHYVQACAVWPRYACLAVQLRLPAHAARAAASALGEVPLYTAVLAETQS